MSDEKGVCFFAYNNDQIDYVELALLAAGYVKKYLELPVCLITDNGSHSWLRESRDKEDIKRCFMLEVFLFYNRENLQENIENIIDELYDDFPDSDEDEGEEKDEDNEIIFEEDIEASFKLSKCSCAMCQTLNNIYDKWSVWTPQTPMQEILQRHINSI